MFAIFTVLQASGAQLLQYYKLALLTVVTVLKASGAVVTVLQSSGAVVTVLQASGAHCCYSISG